MIHLGDITKLHGDAIPPVDCITGGSPCQDLSVAGKRAGLAGERSGLFMEQIRIVKEMRNRDIRNGRTGIHVRPRFIVWENVPGAFSSNKGEDFRAVLEEIVKVVEPDAPPVPLPDKGKWPKSGCLYSDLGDWSVAWRVHDAQFWGVPQRRKRIALVADFGGLAAPEVLFEREGLSGYSEPCGETREGTAAATGSGVEGASGVVTKGNGIDRADTARCNGKGWREDQCYTLNTIDRPAVYDDRGNGDGEIVPTITGDHQRRVTDYTALCVGGNDIAQTLDASYYKGPGSRNGKEREVVATFQNTGRVWWNEHDVAATLRTPCGGDSTKANLVTAVDCRNGTENPDVNGTLQAKSNGGFSYNCQTVCRTNQTVRRLTPLECERLQGFPDGWTDIGDWVDSKGKKHKAADSPRYKALGNSIALPFWFWLLRRISAQYERPATLGSLFDGIGGFPLCWERCNGKGTAIWASEIEEFPIAVTKVHFPEVVQR